MRRSPRFWIPAFAGMTEGIYPGMPHTVNDDEIKHARRLALGVG